MKHVKEMIQLKDILQLEIDIEETICQQNPASTEINVPSGETNSIVANRDQNDDVFQTEESEELRVRQRQSQSSYESGSSFLERVIQNITGDSEEEVEVLMRSFSEHSEDPQAAVQEDEDIKNVQEDEKGSDSEGNSSSDSSSDDDDSDSIYQIGEAGGLRNRHKGTSRPVAVFRAPNALLWAHRLSHGSGPKRPPSMFRMMLCNSLDLPPLNTQE